MNSFVVIDKKGNFHAAYSKNLNLPNQPTPFEQARITAKHPKVRGQVLDVDSEGLSTVVFEDK